MCRSILLDCVLVKTFGRLYVYQRFLTNRRSIESFSIAILDGTTPGPLGHNCLNTFRIVCSKNIDCADCALAAYPPEWIVPSYVSCVVVVQHWNPTVFQPDTHRLKFSETTSASTTRASFVSSCRVRLSALLVLSVYVRHSLSFAMSLAFLHWYRSRFLKVRQDIEVNTRPYWLFFVFLFVLNFRIF